MRKALFFCFLLLLGVLAQDEEPPTETICEFGQDGQTENIPKIAIPVSVRSQSFLPIFTSSLDSTSFEVESYWHNESFQGTAFPFWFPVPTDGSEMGTLTISYFNFPPCSVNVTFDRTEYPGAPIRITYIQQYSNQFNMVSTTMRDGKILGGYNFEDGNKFCKNEVEEDFDLAAFVEDVNLTQLWTAENWDQDYLDNREECQTYEQITVAIIFEEGSTVVFTGSPCVLDGVEHIMSQEAQTLARLINETLEEKFGEHWKTCKKMDMVAATLLPTLAMLLLPAAIIMVAQLMRKNFE